MVAVAGRSTSRAASSASSGSRTRTRRTLVFPGDFDPFTVDARLALVQAEVDALSKKNAKVVVVMGHDGATAGTLTAPVGPLVDLADQLKGVDAVIGDHTNFQVLSTGRTGRS